MVMRVWTCAKESYEKAEVNRPSKADKQRADEGRGAKRGVEIVRCYQLGHFSMRPQADHLFPGSQAHTQPSDALSVT